ncbi:ATP-binding cassette domain-containing protein [Acaryochloris sp. CCMEE 5410]|uniref:ABC transporter ATP-binding protein n=1 Tax=Acaryochloris sp. CCMEE 5410 TaxID=310037 RepID=UPI0002484059|nr:ATP-binding cassette domain-containing protein [Acaryochloris sp. CCMEE 5410]KAI9135348.1 ATP-binding cassette domain-containing protein [Acaryochloris sp. CCMEE 5410]
MLESAGEVPSKPGRSQLQLQQVDVVTELGNQYLLQNVSVDIFTGERIGIIGASGSGKTTLLRLLNRLSSPTSGEIRFEQQLLPDWPVLSLRQQLMLVPQEPKLLGMTVQDALTYPLRLQNLPEQDIASRVQTWRQRFGIPDDWLNSTELQLSVGQRQLVSLARACGTEPKLCLLDEPTSALDPGTIDRVIKALKASGMTLVIASHQFEFLNQMCDRILWLNQGKLILDAPIREINWAEIKAELTAQAEQDDWY